MKFVKLSTSNGEDRWINLDRVTRVSRTHENGMDEPLLMVCFEGGDKVTVHGIDRVNQEAIESLVALLDHFACEPVHAAI